MTLNYVTQENGDLVAVHTDGTRTYLVRSRNNLWVPGKRPGGIVTPPNPPTQVMGGITADMVAVAVQAAGGSTALMLDTPQGIADMFNNALAMSGVVLTSKKQAACLVAQCAQETDWFKTFSEYDGWNMWYAPYYGRGMIQLTHRENYVAFGQWVVSLGMLNNPNHFADNLSEVATVQWAALAAIYYFTVKSWNGKNLWQWCDESSSPWYNISRAINYGSPLTNYIGESYNLRGIVTDAVLAVTPDPTDVTPPAGDLQQRLVNYMHSKHYAYFYTMDTAIRLNPDATGGTDCSALIWDCYRKVAGVEIGTWTGGQQAHGTIIFDVGQTIDENALVLGDLVFFTWFGYNLNFHHVEMYTGPNQTCGHGGPGMGPYDKTLSGQIAGATQTRVRRYV